MAKYDWKQLEKEYILGDYKSVSAFLKNKGIKNNGTNRKYTSGWKDKKRQKQDKNKTKIIEKVIEKESEKEAKKVVKVKDVADEILNKIVINLKITKDTKEIRQLASTLKDINDVLNNKQTENNNTQSLAEVIQKAYEQKVGEK